MREKKIHLEFLRVVAICMVLFQHSKEFGSHLFLTTSNPVEYILSLVLMFACKIAVPVFFMISGALLLGKNEPFGVLFRKRILRMAIVLLAVSAGYYVVIGLTVPGKSLGLYSVFDFFRNLFHEPITAPLWYLYAYLGALLLLPLLRKLAQNLTDKEFMYLFILHLAIVPMVTVLEVLVFRTSLTDQFRPALVMESSEFYMLMGYFLEQKLPVESFTKKKEIFLCLSGLIMILLGALLTHIVCVRDGYTVENVTPILDKFTCLPAVALFITSKRMHFSKKSQKFWVCLGSNVFGLYLMEKGLRELLMPIAEKLSPVLTTLPSCFIWLLAVFVTGQVITAILRKIPFARKFI